MFAAITISDITSLITAVGVAIIGILAAHRLWTDSQREFLLAQQLNSVNKKIDANIEKLVKVDEKMDKAADGMKTAFENVSRAAALLEGKEQGRLEQRAESKIDAIAAKEVKLEDRAITKQDAADIKAEAMEMSDKLTSVKVTGENTNAIVKELAPDATK